MKQTRYPCRKLDLPVVSESITSGYQPCLSVLEGALWNASKSHNTNGALVTCSRAPDHSCSMSSMVIEFDASPYSTLLLEREEERFQVLSLGDLHAVPAKARVKAWELELNVALLTTADDMTLQWSLPIRFWHWRSRNTPWESRISQRDCAPEF